MDSLANWIKDKMVEDIDVLIDNNKEKAAEVLRLTSDGKINVLKNDLPAKLHVALCYVGAVYAKKAGIRSDDAVSNNEIYEWTSLREGTVKPTIKELKDQHYISQVKEGSYKIDYRKIGAILDEALTKR